jgi:ParB-like chromosome segregation protein Spo0J
VGTKTSTGGSAGEEYEDHPLAALFPLMADDELAGLAEDIRKNGLRNPIMIHEGKILDGRNRYRACKLIGREIKAWEVFHLNGKDPLAYVLSQNLHRRHLTPEQRRKVVEAVLKQNPRQSNRRVADQTKADHKTVGTVRKEMERRGEIPHVDKRADSKGRQQPAAKAPGPAADRRKYEARRAAHDKRKAEHAAAEVVRLANDPEALQAELKELRDELYREKGQRVRLEAKVRELELDGLTSGLTADLFKPVGRGRTDPLAEAGGWRKGITQWFRALALKYHPDRGGDDRIMAALNDAMQRLLALFPGGAK